MAEWPAERQDLLKAISIDMHLLGQYESRPVASAAYSGQ